MGSNRGGIVTEQEWRVFRRPGEVLHALSMRVGHAGRNDPAYAEKLRRFAIACCRRMGRLLVPDDECGLDLLDAYCGTRDEGTLKSARKALRAGSAAVGPWTEVDGTDLRSAMTWWALGSRQAGPRRVPPAKAVTGRGCVLGRGEGGRPGPSSRFGALPPLPIHNTPDPTPAELAVQCALLRDIFGNPFRPVAFSPTWRTDTAMTLAKLMYESREFACRDADPGRCTPRRRVRQRRHPLALPRRRPARSRMLGGRSGVGEGVASEPGTGPLHIGCSRHRSRRAWLVR